MAHALAEAARSLRRALKGFEPSTLRGEDAATIAEELALTEKVCAAAWIIAAAHAAGCGAHRDRGFTDAPAWLAHEAGTTSRQAKDALATAASLKDFPATRDALVEGEISIPQAHEITRAAAEMPAIEEELLEAARRGDLTTVRDEALEQKLARTPAEELHREQHESRRFRHWRDRLGMVRITAALPPEIGVPLVTRVEREAARRHREAKANGTAELFEAYAADALVSLTDDGVGEKGGKGRVDLVIVCDLYAWRRGHAHDGEPCHVVGGGPIPVWLAKQLAADAFLKVVLHDGKDIQKVHHAGRRYTAELRSALDLGPVPAFSGRECVDCGRRGFGLERDHDVPVASTGPTSMSNVKDRCYRCHAEKTERDREAGLLVWRGTRDQDRSRTPSAQGSPPHEPPAHEPPAHQPPGHQAPAQQAHAAAGGDPGGPDPPP